MGGWAGGASFLGRVVGCKDKDVSVSWHVEVHAANKKR